MLPLDTLRSLIESLTHTDNSSVCMTFGTELEYWREGIQSVLANGTGFFPLIYLRLKAMEDGTVVSAPRIEIVNGGMEAAQSVFDMLKEGIRGKKSMVQVP